MDIRLMRRAVCAVAVMAGPLAGQSPAPEVTQLAAGVYAVRLPPSPISDSNVLLIINEEDVIVVDTNILPGSARTVIAELRKLTSKPVRYIVNTHWHSDHHYGNETYLKAYPGAEIIQHVTTRREIIARDVPALESNLKTAYPEIIARYRRALESGRTAQGAPVTDQLRRDLTGLVQVYERFLTDMGASRIVPGTLLVSDSLVLHRGERTIVLKYLGKGNTAGDIIVHLPRERIVATGDLVVHPIPFSFFSFLADWPSTLRSLKTLDARWIVPGHGELQRDWRYVDRLIPLIESTWDQVRRAVSAGVPSLDSARKLVNLDAFRQEFGGDDERRRRQFDNLFFNPATEAAFRELKPDTASSRRSAGGTPDGPAAPHAWSARLHREFEHHR